MSSDSLSCKYTRLACWFVGGLLTLILLLSDFFDITLVRIIYGLVPLTSFVGLSALFQYRISKGKPPFPIASQVGAVFGLLTGNVLPYVLIIMDLHYHNAGGANIGLSILAMLSPITVLPLFGFCGFMLGAFLQAKRESTKGT